MLAAGWLLGGTVGIGTLLFALLIGPLVHVALSLLDTRRPVVADAAERADTPEATPRDA